MEAELAKKKVLTLPYTRKLTGEEIEELLQNWDYDPHRFDDDDDDELTPIYDRYGNPTVETMDAMYESRHGIGDIVTVEEAIAEIYEACSRRQSLQERIEAGQQGHLQQNNNRQTA